MSQPITVIIDGVEVKGTKGETILELADQAGVYIPRLCYSKDLVPGGACRVCTVLVDGRPQSACTYPAANGMVVESMTPELHERRKQIIEMLFVEGNHYCMFCEKSGNCELQATAYRLGILAPRYPYQFPLREVDASHADVMVDHNRCILCGRCVRASRDVDGKNVFQFVQRGHRTRVAVNSASGLGATELAVTDKAAAVCPVGAIIKKRVGFAVPVGQRLYDHKPIGSDIEARRP